jgi:hypothetical protein
MVLERCIAFINTNSKAPGCDVYFLKRIGTRLRPDYEELSRTQLTTVVSAAPVSNTQ